MYLYFEIFLFGVVIGDVVLCCLFLRAWACMCVCVCKSYFRLWMCLQIYRYGRVKERERESWFGCCQFVVFHFNIVSHFQHTTIHTIESFKTHASPSHHILRAPLLCNDKFSLLLSIHIHKFNVIYTDWKRETEKEWMRFAGFLLFLFSIQSLGRTNERTELVVVVVVVVVLFHIFLASHLSLILSVACAVKIIIIQCFLSVEL